MDLIPHYLDSLDTNDCVKLDWLSDHAINLLLRELIKFDNVLQIGDLRE